jgi:glutamate-1-semialdehyde 2,1-aminomutase
MGVVPPADGFLEGLRDLTSNNGAMLIFDEVITGFRVGPHGAQGLFGVTPDITTMGKIIGGGLPVGAYGARREIMERVAPLGDMYQAGTLSGNPLAVSAGVATLTELRVPGVYDRIDRLAQRLTDGLSEAFQRVEIPSTINRVGSMFTGFMNPGPVDSLERVEASDAALYGQYFHAMLERGVYIAPSQFEAGFVSTAHTEEDIDETVSRAEAALRELG